MENTPPTTKTCKECGRELPLEQFSKNPHGYTSLCKDCMKAKQSAGLKRQRALPSDNPEIPGDVLSGPHKHELRPLGKHAPAVQVVLANYSDEDLAAELRRRGYAGTLTKSHSLSI